MTSITKKIVIIVAIIAAYLGLGYLAQLTLTPRWLCLAIPALQLSFLIILLSTIIVYATHASFTRRSTEAILLLIITTILAIMVVPTFVYLIKYYTAAACQEFKGIPVTAPMVEEIGATPAHTEPTAQELSTEPAQQPQEETPAPEKASEMPAAQEAGTDLTELKTIDDFHSFIKNNADKPTVIKIFATWCGPCKAMAPHFKKAAEAFKGKIAFAELDASEEFPGREELNLTGLPTVIIYKDGKEHDRIAGYRDAAQLEGIFSSL